jgi:hypothetical protein
MLLEWIRLTDIVVSNETSRGAGYAGSTNPRSSA